MSFSARDSRRAPQASGTATAHPTRTDSSTVTASGRASGRTEDAAAPPKPTPPSRAAIAGTENGPSASGWPKSPISPANSDSRSTTIPRAPTSRKTAATVLPSSTPPSAPASQLRYETGKEVPRGKERGSWRGGHAAGGEHPAPRPRRLLRRGRAARQAVAARAAGGRRRGRRPGRGGDGVLRGAGLR